MDTSSRSDPISETLRLLTRDRRRTVVMFVIAATAHAAAAWALPRHATRLALRDSRPIQIVDIDMSRQRPAPPIAAAMVPEPPSLPAVKTPTSRVQPTSKAPVATAPPVPAAAVLTRQSDANEPVDLSDTFITGSASTYAGGVTSAQGGTGPNGQRGVEGLPRESVPSTPSPPPRTAPSPDRSRRPSLAGDREWKCPFPPEADADNKDSAVVTLRIEVLASGTVRSVSVEKDPGYGFGREARRCALARTWAPGLDRDGRVSDGTAVVTVHFER
jgi:protein TonB